MMNPREMQTFDASMKNSNSMSVPSRNLNPNQLFASQFDSRSLCYGARNEQSFPEFSPPLDDIRSLHPYYSEKEVMKPNPTQEHPLPLISKPALNWDPRGMLSNLSVLEQKIHQMQDMVRSVINLEGQHSFSPNGLAAQQQLVTADLTCVIIQLISTAGTLLPPMKSALLSTSPYAGQLGNIIGSSSSLLNSSSQQNEVFQKEEAKASEINEIFNGLNNSMGEATEPIAIEDHDVKDHDDGVDVENLPPGSYEVLQLEKEEILAPHTHFCLVCGKGFKRDANLRMHMRGHGDEYKTAAALAKPAKESSSEPVPIKRYSCPFVGCKRNKEHKKFQPLKTILCVKNHYKRSHCDKSYICSRCNTKKFSVIADLKTHEKHCGRDKWLCSCGTTFSRKDKLFGHVALFQGHTPALPIDEVKGSGASDQGKSKEATTEIESLGYKFAGDRDGDAILDIKGLDDDRDFFSAMSFDSCNFGGLDDFPRPTFDMSDGSFSFPSESSNFIPKNGENPSFNRMG